jgi:hypothetical protein
LSKDIRLFSSIKLRLFYGVHIYIRFFACTPTNTKNQQKNLLLKKTADKDEKIHCHQPSSPTAASSSIARAIAVMAIAMA